MPFKASQLVEAGFSREAINKMIDRQRPVFKSAGFTDHEINKHYGIVPNKSLLEHEIIAEDPQVYNEKQTEPFPNNLLKQELVKNDPDNLNELAIQNEFKFNSEQMKSWMQLDPNTQTIMQKEFNEVFKEFFTDDEGRISLTPIPEEEYGLKDMRGFDMKYPDNKDVELMQTALNEDKPDIKYYEDLIKKNQSQRKIANDKRQLKKLETNIEKEILGDAFPLLDTINLVNGKESQAMKEIVMDRFKLQEYEYNNFAMMLSMIAGIESDNRNIHSANPDSTAAGLWQVNAFSVPRVINAFNKWRSTYDRTWESPEFVSELREHKDMTALMPDKQMALVIADYLEAKGSDELIRRIVQGDVQAMKDFYYRFHYRDEDALTETEMKKKNPALVERVDKYFSYWNNRAGLTKFVSPKLATFPVDNQPKTEFGKKLRKLGEKITKPLKYYMGGQGNIHAFSKGYEQSVAGLFQKYLENADGGMTDEELTNLFKELIMFNENQTFGDNLIKSVGQIIPDIPLMIGGALAFPSFVNTVTGGVAAPLTPMTAMMGAFMLPEMLRAPLMQGYIDGKYNTFGQFMDDFISVENGKVMLKSGTIGAATSFGGHLVKNIASRRLKFTRTKTEMSKLMAEAGIMTQLGFALEGEVPALKDFVHSAILMFGLHTTMKQVHNLINIYKKYGRRPEDVFNEAQANSAYKETLRKSEIPEFYDMAQEMAGRKAENVTGQKLLTVPEFQINETVNSTVSGRDKVTIINKEIVGNDSVFVVQDARGNVFPVLESQVRKLDPQRDIDVEVTPEGKLDIKDKKIPDESPQSFKSRQTNGEFHSSFKEVEVTKNKDVVIKGEQPKTIQDNLAIIKKEQKLPDVQGLSQFRYDYTGDGKVFTDGVFAVTTKYYPNVEKGLKQYSRNTIPAIHKETQKTFYDKIYPKSERRKTNAKLEPYLQYTNEGVEVLVLKNKVTKDNIEVHKARFDLLHTFKEQGKDQKADVVLQNNKVLFINPNNQEVIGTLMLRKQESEFNTQYDKYYDEFSQNFKGGTSNYSRSTRDGDSAGIPNEPYTPRQRATGNRDTWKELYDSGVGLKFYDLTVLVEHLLGAAPKMSKMRRGHLGVFRHLKEQDFNKPIKEQAQIVISRELQEKPEEFIKTLAHELGHLIDFVPDRSTRRGNILGHIKKMRRYMKDWIDGKNDGAKPLSNAEKKEMMKEAERIAEANKEITEVEIKELEVTPETILNITRDPNIREKIDPELYLTYAKLSNTAKAEVMKDAVKGLTSPHLKEIIDKINNKNAPEISGDAAQLFKEMFEAEMLKRNIVRKEEIMNELKALSMKWHPFNRATEKPSYVKYRDSAPELMAEFQMAFLLRPQWTKLNAPKTFELWKYYMSERPEVYDMWRTIQSQLNAPRNERDAQLANDFKAMLIRQDNKIRDHIKGLAKHQKQKKYDDLGTELLDVFWWSLTRLKIDGQKGKSPLSQTLLDELEGFRHRWAEGQLYQRTVENKIDNQLENFGYNKHDLAYMMTLKNLAFSKQREGKITWRYYPLPESTKESLKESEGSLVEMYERYAAEQPELARIADEFFELRRTEVVQRFMDYEVYSDVQKQEFLDNINYIKFQPAEKLIERFGKFGMHSWGSKQIRQTIGSFDEIVNVYDMTVMQDMMMLAEMKRQTLYKSFVDFLKTYKTQLSTFGADKDAPPLNIINIPKYIAKGKLDPVVPLGLSRVSYMHKGEVYTVDIPKQIVEAMQSNPLAQNILFKTINSATSLWRGIFTEHNPLFWIWNWGFRDMRRSAIILPNGKPMKSVVTRAQYVKEVFKSLKDAQKSIYGDGTEITRHMEKHGFLIGLQEAYKSDAGMKRNRLQMDEESFALKSFVWEKYESKGKFGKIHDKTLGKYLRHSGNIARLLDRSHKIAGYKILKNMIEKGEIDMTEGQLMRFVQANVGSPNYLRQSKSNPVLNTMFLYYNANKEGYRGDIGAAIEDKSGVGSRFFAYTVFPEILKWMVRMGLLGGAYAVLMDTIPDHDRQNFNIIPMGYTPDGRPVYIRIPMDFTSQMIASLTNMSLETAFGLDQAKNNGERIRMFWKGINGGLPTGQINPAVKMMVDTMRVVFGEDVTNTFGSPLLDKDVMKLDITDLEGKKLKAILKHNWNVYGPNWVYKFHNNDKAKILKEYEQITGFRPIDAIFSRFVKVGPQVIVDKKREYDKINADHQNKMLVARQDAINKILSGRVSELNRDEKNSLGLLKQDVIDNNEFIRQLVQQFGANELVAEFLNGDRQQKLHALKAMEYFRHNYPQYFEKVQETIKKAKEKQKQKELENQE